MSDFEPRRNIERFLATAYLEFERRAYKVYGEDTARQRLIMVRQFCRFLQDGEGPTRNYAPAPPRP